MMVLFNKKEREILETYTGNLLRTCKMSFASVPEPYEKVLDPEKWQDHTLDVGLELKKSLTYLRTGNIAGYDAFLSSDYSLILKELVDNTTNNLLDYFNPYQNSFLLKSIGKHIAKAKLNSFRNKLGLAQL